MSLQPDPDKDAMPRCRCGRGLWSSNEREFKICNTCADESYDREMRRCEFVYYHSDDEPGEHQVVMDAIEAHNSGEEE